MSFGNPNLSANPTYFTIRITEEQRLILERACSLFIAVGNASNQTECDEADMLGGMLHDAQAETAFADPVNDFNA